jgi:hypothetical protein
MGDHVAGQASSSEKPHNSFYFPTLPVVMSSTFCPVEPFEKLKKSVVLYEFFDFSV